MMIPTASIKINGQWVPVNSLSQEQQEKIRLRAVKVLQEAVERQVAIMMERQESGSGEGVSG